jgi:hypothetical protein
VVTGDLFEGLVDLLARFKRLVEELSGVRRVVADCLLG